MHFLFEARDVHLPMIPGGLTSLILELTCNAHWRPASSRSSVWAIPRRPERTLDLIVELGSHISSSVRGF